MEMEENITTNQMLDPILSGPKSDRCDPCSALSRRRTCILPF